MRDRHQGAHSSVDVAGVWFELEELRRLQAIGVAGGRGELLAPPRAYEEVVLLRRGGAPAPILATLHKAPDGDLVVTRLDDARLATPGTRTAFATLDATLPVLRRMLRH